MAKIFLLLTLFSYFAIKHFTPSIPFFETVLQIIRKHEVSSIQLSGVDSVLFYLINSVSVLITYLDNQIRFFPTWVRLHYWDLNNLIFLLILPINILVAFVASKFEKKWIVVSFFLIWVLPVKYIAQIFSDYIVIKYDLNYTHLLSKKSDWIWVEGDQVKPDYVARFSYTWDQKKSPNSADIQVTCLGHYRIKVNGRTVGRGPVFSKYPQFFFDKYDIKQEIIIGKNTIDIDCEYLSSKTHEHEVYERPGLYVSGQVNDGLISRNLGDWRFWKGGLSSETTFIKKLSTEGGFTEEINVNSSQPLGRVRQIDHTGFSLSERPIAKLIYNNVTINKKNDFFDLGVYTTGYLSLAGESESPCSAKISYHEQKQNQPELGPHHGQQDLIHIPDSKFEFEQFGRRSGRYIKIDSDCSGKIEPTFTSVSYPFDKFLEPNNLPDIDKQIFSISMNSLTNGLQDQVEDSLVREKALYVGDVLAVYSCIPKTNNNLSYLKSAITQFALSQIENGAIPAMAHSGNTFTIPDYSLQWIVLLEKYVSESKDLNYAKEMLPVITRVLEWAKANESSDGFLFDKNIGNWWTFIDWTPIDRSYRYVTALQLWYLEALKSAETIFAMTDYDYSLKNKIESLESSVKDRSFISEKNIYSDSFNDVGMKSSGGLVTNALAGKLGYLSGSDSIKIFEKNLITDSAFSQTWVIEWLLKENRPDLALETMRKYWGSMINAGATSVYEKYKLAGEQFNEYSVSHAWGCGPVFLYQDIYK